jgi:hypothetical protein
VVVENGSDGVDVDAGSVVDGVTAIGNGKDGIEIDGRDGVVMRSSARGNGERGFNLTAYARFGNDNVSGENMLNDSCGGGLCTHKTRHYLTNTSSHDGSNALTACAAGFHMASLWEIFETSHLVYDTALGRVSNDSGSGPTSQIGGWMRTGLGNSSGTPGFDNCGNWTSNDSRFKGSWVRLNRRWISDSPEQSISRWEADNFNCNVSLNVWCVEDH